MLSVHIVSKDNEAAALEYLNNQKIQFDFDGRIAMLCTDGAAAAGMVGARLWGEDDVRAEVELLSGGDGEIVYLLCRSIFHILERRGIYDVTCTKEEYFPFLKLHRMKETKQDGKPALTLDLRGYFDAGCGQK